MPYVVTDEGRYLGEHDCNNYHYGEMWKIRECCLNDYLKRQYVANRVAMTKYHPSAQLAVASWNSLTDLEMTIADCFIKPKDYLL